MEPNKEEVAELQDELEQVTDGELDERPSGGEGSTNLAAHGVWPGQVADLEL